MKRKNKIILSIIILVLILLAWAPWITDDYAIKKITEKLGGSEAYFNYLGENTKINEIPKYVKWLPFTKAVYFPSEAVFFVTFYGDVI